MPAPLRSSITRPKGAVKTGLDMREATLCPTTGLGNTMTGPSNDFGRGSPADWYRPRCRLQRMIGLSRVPQVRVALLISLVRGPGMQHWLLHVRLVHLLQWVRVLGPQILVLQVIVVVILWVDLLKDAMIVVS